MKLSIKYHAGNPNICRIPEIAARPLPECEGGGFYIPRDQAEKIVAINNAAHDWWEDRIPKDDAEKALMAALAR